MIVVTIQPNGWSCSCDDNAFYSTMTGSSAGRDGWKHAERHHGAEQVQIRDTRRAQAQS